MRAGLAPSMDVGGDRSLEEEELMDCITYKDSAASGSYWRRSYQVLNLLWLH